MRIHPGQVVGSMQSQLSSLLPPNCDVFERTWEKLPRKAQDVIEIIAFLL